MQMFGSFCLSEDLFLRILHLLIPIMISRRPVKGTLTAASAGLSRGCSAQRLKMQQLLKRMEFHHKKSLRNVLQLEQSAPGAKPLASILPDRVSHEGCDFPFVGFSPGPQVVPEQLLVPQDLGNISSAFVLSSTFTILRIPLTSLHIPLTSFP